MSWSYLKTCIECALDTLHVQDRSVVKVREDQDTGKVHVILPSCMKNSDVKHVQECVDDRWFSRGRIVISRQP